MSLVPLSAEDAAERAQFLRFAFLLGLPAAFLLGLLDYGLVATGRLSGTGGLVFGLLIIPLTGALIVVTWQATGGMAAGLVKVLYGAGNLRPAPQHSAEEALVARGFYREAADAYAVHLAASPGDNAARIKLGSLYHEHLRDPAAAEHWYLEVRRHGPTPQQEALVSHLLLRLYEATGQRGREMVELARFAERYRHSRAGRDAARRLRELKAEGGGGAG